MLHPLLARMALSAVVLLVSALGAWGVAAEPAAPVKAGVRAPPSVRAAQTPVPPTVAEVASHVAPSIVQIIAGEGLDAGRGSGVKIDAGIVTVDHVVGDAERVAVVTTDGRSGTALVEHRAPLLDLVLLRTDLEVPSLELDATSRQQGDTVLAFGYPRPDALGTAEGPTLTRGLISAIREDAEGVTYIQTDAAVAPGSSGGALVNSRGQLIAIPTFGVAESPSLNFAVSSDAIQRLKRPPPELSAAGPSFRGSPREVLLTASDLGPGWEPTVPIGDDLAGEGATADLDTATAVKEFIRGDVNDPSADMAALFSAALVEDDAPGAQRSWERMVRQPPLGLERLPDPKVADVCRAYAIAQGKFAEFHVLCREANVVVVVGLQGVGDAITHDAAAYYAGIMTQRVRDEAG